MQPTLSNTADGSSLLFGRVKEVDMTEILATLPPKHEINTLLRQFFDLETFPITVARKLVLKTFRTAHKLTKAQQS